MVGDTPHPRPARARVLLAEDDDDVRFAFQLVLEDRYELRMAASGAALLALAADARPDVVLLDWTLPDVDGEVLVARLRALPGASDAPIIAVSGAAAFADIAARAGAFACPKPCDAEALIGAIETALASSGSRAARQ